MVKTTERIERLRTVVEKLRARIKSDEEEKNALKEKIKSLEAEVIVLNEKLKSRIDITDIEPETREIVEKLRREAEAKDAEIAELKTINKNLIVRIKDKDDSNARIARLCNILLQDKSALMEANRKLYERMEYLQQVVSKLQTSNEQLEKRIREMIEALQLTTNF